MTLSQHHGTIGVGDVAREIGNEGNLHATKTTLLSGGLIPRVVRVPVINGQTNDDSINFLELGGSGIESDDFS